MEMTKAWYKSRIVWLNAASFLSMALALTEVTTLIPLVAMPYVAALNALVNLYLRFGTDTPLGTRDRIGWRV